MKYERLPKSELEKLEKEFVDFLVVNGITAHDWIQLKEDSEKSNEIINQFSDVIWESVLRKSEYIEFTQGEQVFCFRFEPNTARLKIVKKNKDGSKSVVSMQSKPYQREREVEMFELLRSGGVITEGELFKSAD